MMVHDAPTTVSTSQTAETATNVLTTQTAPKLRVEMDASGRLKAYLAGNNKNLVLPVPAFNVTNGGSHAGNKTGNARIHDPSRWSKIFQGGNENGS
ncbi:hypothetical protein C5167_006031 [Papaver somniferum]|uniref:phosphopyruvate hydratase n=1 Tax=Papaver somniferum TaxID=3469 RepID=A0A4Y7JGF3_PAPSO|nr:hypothetical protein C5167_006031 [Papaver somniferum]